MSYFLNRDVFLDRAVPEPKTSLVVEDVPLPTPIAKPAPKPKQPKHPVIDAAPGLPRPERKALWLVSEGLKRPTWTIHFFVESRECDEGIEFLYQCSKTNVLRRFGLLPHPFVFTPRA